MMSSLRIKSRLTSQSNRLRSAVTPFAKPKVAPVRSGFRLTVKNLRPCSRLTGALDGLIKIKKYYKMRIQKPGFKSLVIGSRVKMVGLSAFVMI